MDEKDTSFLPAELIAQALEDFIRSVESLADTFPLVVSAIHTSQSENHKKSLAGLMALMKEFTDFHNIVPQGDQIDNIEDVDIKTTEETGEIVERAIKRVFEDVSWMKASSQRFPYMMRHFHDLAKELEKLTLANRLVQQSFVISLISQYDAFLGKLIRALFLMKPETLNASERNITFLQLQEFGSVEDAKEYIIEKEIESILRESHPEQFDWLERKYGIELRKGLDVWPTFVEATQRRNLFVRNNGVISNQYISVCQKHNVGLIKSVKLGEKVEVTPEYFREVYECILEIGIKLAHVLWRKVYPQGREKADSNLISTCFDLLQRERYHLACVLLDFSTEVLKKHASDENRRIFIVNRAQAYKWLGNREKSIKIINGEDWSASSDKFRLAVAVIMDDFERADSLVRKIGAHGDITMDFYREWPLFREYRKSEGFLKNFEETFGELFYSEEDLSAAINAIKDAIASDIVEGSVNLDIAEIVTDSGDLS